MVPQLFSPSGLIVTPGGLVYGAAGQKVIPVHDDGPGNLSDAPAWWNEDGRTSVQNALSLCRSGRGDAIQLLPGHTESIAAADAWSNLGTKTGITVLGPSVGPPATFTWTVAAATLLMDAADFVIDGGPNKNIILNLEPGTGTVTVAAPITVSAARCKIRNCRIRVGTDASNLVTIGITTTAGADQFQLLHNVVRGAAAAAITTFLRLVGLSDCEVAYNDIVCGTSAAAVGPIQALTTAPVDVNIHHNHVHNNAASSTACITGMAAMTGWIADNRLRNETDASNAHIPTPGAAQLYENYGVNDDGETGILIGTASI